MTVAAGLSSFVGYAVINFMPSFLVRSFDMDLSTLGFWLGPILGIAGGFGFFVGGYIADHLGRTSRKRALGFIGLTVLLTSIPYAVMFLSGSWLVAILVFIVPACTANVYLAPVLAQAQGLVSLRMRAVTSAIALLVINVIGLLFGPQVTGILSTLLEPQFGEEAIRYSLLLITSVFLPWAAWHYFRAGRTIDDDLARASEHD
jgi:MFS family permease